MCIWLCIVGSCAFLSNPNLTNDLETTFTTFLPESDFMAHGSGRVEPCDPNEQCCDMSNVPMPSYTDLKENRDKLTVWPVEGTPWDPRAMDARLVYFRCVRCRDVVLAVEGSEGRWVPRSKAR